MLVAAVLSKFVACGAGALGMGRTDAIRVGVGMVPRGEVGMVVAQIGLNLGVIGARHLRHHRLHVGGDHADRAAAAEAGVRIADAEPEQEDRWAGAWQRGACARKPARYNIGDVTKYIRYQSASGVSYGILEGDTVHEIRGACSTRTRATGADPQARRVKLLYPCEPGKILAVGLNYRSHLGTRPQPRTRRCSTSR